MAEKKVTKDDLFWVFVKSNFLLGSFNFERMQAMGNDAYFKARLYRR